MGNFGTGETECLGTAVKDKARPGEGLSGRALFEAVMKEMGAYWILKEGKAQSNRNVYLFSDFHEDFQNHLMDKWIEWLAEYRDESLVAIEEEIRAEKDQLETERSLSGRL